MKRNTSILLILISVFALGFTFYNAEVHNEEETELHKTKEVTAFEEDNKQKVEKDANKDKVTTKDKDKPKQEKNKAKKEIPAEEKTPKTEETFEYIWSEEKYGTVEEEYINDSNLKKDSREVIDEGKTGLKKVEIKITYHNGSEVSRENTGEEEIVSKVQNKLIKIGTKIEIINDDSFLTNESNHLLSIINEYRASKQLKKFVRSENLKQSANIRAKEITNVFDHTRPDGSPWYTVDEAVNSENLAYGYTTQGTLDAWIESPDHYKNLLNDHDYAAVSMYKTPDGTVYTVLLTGV